MILAAAMLGAPAADALEHNLNFDQGVDVSGLVKEAKKEVKAAGVNSKFEARPLFRREERDCATVSFRPGDPMTSERISLESRIYEEICYNIPDAPRHPRPHPRKGDRIGDRRPNHSYNAKSRECHERWVSTERRQARIEVSGRGEMLPWERDIFQVCLQGQWLSAHVVDASHKYSLDVPGWNGDTVLARALSKNRANPDPNGIQAAFGFDQETGSFSLQLKDRWIEFYEGEKVTVEVRLVRYYKNWFDSTALKTEITIPAAEVHRVNFADYAQELSGDLKPGKEYYVKWRFKRVGQISNDKWQDYRETEKVTYEGAEIKALLTASVE
ncbi:MAG: hypothetical protein ABIJ96_09875 [Elusimicrobiota bacterium]